MFRAIARIVLMFKRNIIMVGISPSLSSYSCVNTVLRHRVVPRGYNQIM
jgi:hypothetical protein